MKIILYTNDCPRCNILKKKLEQKNIQFVENHNIETIVEKGFDFAPVLQINEDFYTLKQANAWLEEQ